MRDKAAQRLEACGPNIAGCLRLFVNLYEHAAVVAGVIKAVASGP
jgi:hypothetical protein